jgi:hypothetical protein
MVVMNSGGTNSGERLENRIIEPDFWSVMKLPSIGEKPFTCLLVIWEKCSLKKVYVVSHCMSPHAVLRREHFWCA